MAIDSLNITSQWLRSIRRQARRLVAVAVLATLAGCTSAPERDPLPAEYTNYEQVIRTRLPDGS